MSHGWKGTRKMKPEIIPPTLKILAISRNPYLSDSAPLAREPIVSPSVPARLTPAAMISA